MKKSLPSRSSYKKEQLQEIVNIIRSVVDIKMIILFGSYARGTWVEDIYTDPEDHITYEYKSDIDILAVTETRGQANSIKIWDKVDQLINNCKRSTSVSIIAHDIKELNKKIEMGEYFFVDIKKEGVILYNSGEYKLAKPKKLSDEERKEVAKEDYNYWYGSANDFFEQFEFAFNKAKYNIAAFQLHQATERLYVTLLLIFIQYRPKIHDLNKLSKKVRCFDPRLLTIFPRKTKKEKHLFNLLKRAYVEARYKKSYTITKEELEYLSLKVEKLIKLTEEICMKKIEGISKKNNLNIK